MSTANAANQVVRQAAGRTGLMAPAASTAQAPAQASSGNYQIQPQAPGRGGLMEQPQATPTPTPATAPQTPAATPTPATPPQPPAPAQNTAPQQPRQLQADETVEGRLNAMTAANSPYMNLARDYALRDMNKRGLMQSSIAIGAAHEAAIRNALPVAQQDAQQQFTVRNNFDLNQLENSRTGTPTQRDYVTLATSGNDRYATEFSRIQESSMTQPQKDAAITALKEWKVANDNWLNVTFAQFDGIKLNLQPFFTGAPASGGGATPAPAATTPAGSDPYFSGTSSNALVDGAAIQADLLDAAGNVVADAASSAARNTSGNAVIDGIARQAELLGLGDGVGRAVNNVRQQWREIF